MIESPINQALMNENRGGRYRTVCTIKQGAFAYHSIYCFVSYQGLQPDLCKGHNTKLAVFFVIDEMKPTQSRAVRLPTHMGQLNWH